MRVVVDTSIWIDHLLISDLYLIGLLERRQVLTHPFVLGEIAIGHVRNRNLVLRELAKLRQSAIARDEEVMRAIAERKWFGKGIGYLDAHLLVSVLITPDAKLWTRDKNLAELARNLHVSYQPKAN